MSGFWNRDSREKWNEDAINSLLEQKEKSRFDQPVKKKKKSAEKASDKSEEKRGQERIEKKEQPSEKTNGAINEEREDAEAVRELTSDFEEEIFGASEDGGEAAEETKEDAFADMEPLLDSRILRAVKEMGFTKLSPIQEQAIPCLLNGDDIIGQAQTGTGKTAAFGIPAIQKIDPELKKLQVIILCPTRELAIQAAEELRKLARFMHGVKVLPVYGGQEIGRQIMGLKGVQIIVGTPGRVMDHMRRHTIRLDDIKMVVLDEADEMLNMGFREDMETILGQIQNEHQTALFSATMPQPILDITNQFQKDAKLIKIAAKELTIPLVSQRYYRVRKQDKDAACIRLLEYYQPKLTLIFCNTKKKVDELAEVLKKQGYQAEGLHGDMSQHQRDVAMGRFRNGSTSILIATDVAARGIDVDDVEAVINYDIPQDIEYYVHRIGRTGRAGRTGRSFTFVSGRDIYQLRNIERVCHTVIEEKKLPGAAKVLKAKADKYLNHAWELHEHEDMELMKKFLERKMTEEGCDALELAAAMLKYQVGDKGEEIAVDDFGTKKRGDRSRDDRRSDRNRSDRDRGGRSGSDRDRGQSDRSRSGKSRNDGDRFRGSRSGRGRDASYRGRERSQDRREGSRFGARRGNSDNRDRDYYNSEKRSKGRKQTER